MMWQGMGAAMWERPGDMGRGDPLHFYGASPSQVTGPAAVPTLMRAQDSNKAHGRLGMFELCLRRKLERVAF